MRLFLAERRPLRRLCSSTGAFELSRCFHASSGLTSLDTGVWAPTRKEANVGLDSKKESTLSVLESAGYIYQAHAGIFHTLPLGLRVLNKINRIVDMNMESIGGQKVAMSSLSTQDLWDRTGRYQTSKDQLFGVKDRRESGFLLAPTHEEEITSMIAASVKSSKDLPLRLYQIGPKYRDEPRPRQGLLRAREFVMKDLYSFDATPELAVESYNAVRQAYDQIFASLGLPVVTAEADSGMMGGVGSHEYHLVSTTGEDTLLICESCHFAANSEVLSSLSSTPDSASYQCPKCKPQSSSSGCLTPRRAIELAHTFNLGTRYSLPLGATLPSVTTGKPVPLYMGCYGIGISRVLGALAATKVDSVGLNWRPGVAPYDVVVMPRKDDTNHISIAQQVASSLKKLELPSSLSRGSGGSTIPVDVLLDNRQSKRSLIWRLNDADMAGYPIIVLVPARPQGETGITSDLYAEIQCRQLNVKTHVRLADVPPTVNRLLVQLLE